MWRSKVAEENFVAVLLQVVDRQVLAGSPEPQVHWNWWRKQDPPQTLDDLPESHQMAPVTGGRLGSHLYAVAFAGHYILAWLLRQEHDATVVKVRQPRHFCCSGGVLAAEGLNPRPWGDGRYSA